MTDSLDSWVAYERCLRGSKMICNIDRQVALGLTIEMRKVYGATGNFTNTYFNGVTHLSFERAFPHLADFFRNDERFDTRVDHEGRIFLSNR